MNKNKFFTKDRIFFMILAVSGLLFAVTAVILYAVGVAEIGSGSIKATAFSALNWLSVVNIVVGVLGLCFRNCIKTKTTLIALALPISFAIGAIGLSTDSVKYPEVRPTMGWIFAVCALICVALLVYYFNIKLKQASSGGGFKAGAGVAFDVVTAVVYVVPCVYVVEFAVRYITRYL